MINLDMTDFIRRVLPKDGNLLDREKRLERERYRIDFITHPNRERELYLAGYLTNNLELSDSSDDDFSDCELPLQQFDKRPKSD
jgi:hypothetical protein